MNRADAVRIASEKFEASGAAYPPKFAIADWMIEAVQAGYSKGFDDALRNAAATAKPTQPIAVGDTVRAIRDVHASIPIAKDDLFAVKAVNTSLSLMELHGAGRCTAVHHELFERVGDERYEFESAYRKAHHTALFNRNEHGRYTYREYEAAYEGWKLAKGQS